MVRQLLARSTVYSGHGQQSTLSYPCHSHLAALLKYYAVHGTDYLLLVTLAFDIIQPTLQLITVYGCKLTNVMWTKK
jgi:hypothetical protein